MGAIGGLGQVLPLPGQSGWLDRQLGKLLRLVFIAAVVAGLVALATVVTAWTLSRGASAPAIPRAHYTSSAGVTGTAGTRVSDLSPTTFVGQVPFMAQLRWAGAQDGAAAPTRFVEGAREAGLAGFIGSIASDVTLPYARSAVDTGVSVTAWTDAVQEQRQAAVVRSVISGSSAWQAPAIAGGSVIHGVTSTFYACVGNGFCGDMATGLQVFDGAAACSSDLPFGTRFVVNGDPSGRVFTCLDRGALTPTWVDVWFYDVADGYAWASMVGSNVNITIVN